MHDLNGINKTIDSFKKVIGYILLRMLKYTPMVGPRVQEACNKEVLKKPRSLAFIPDIFKTQEMCIKALEVDPWLFKYVPDNLKTQKMCDDCVLKDSYTLKFVPDNLKTQKMCKEAVRNSQYALEYVPDHLKTEKMCKGVRSPHGLLVVFLIILKHKNCARKQYTGIHTYCGLSLIDLCDKNK